MIFVMPMTHEPANMPHPSVVTIDESELGAGTVMPEDLAANLRALALDIFNQRLDSNMLNTEVGRYVVANMPLLIGPIDLPEFAYDDESGDDDRAA